MTLDYVANQAIHKQLRIMGYTEGSVEWDGALAAARAFVANRLTQYVPIPAHTVEQGRPFGELSDSGLLWLINRVVFHPRGFRLAMVAAGGVATGWELQGDGTEPHWFPEDLDRARFELAEATLRAVRPAGDPIHSDQMGAAA